MEANEPQYFMYPKDPWNEIVPGLFQGGQVTKEYWQGGAKVKVGSEFGAVFSFYWGPSADGAGAMEETYGPDPGVIHVHYPIPDGPLSDFDLTNVKGHAEGVAAFVRHGEKVLVRCQAGYNRSGLVVAFALMELGYNVHDAIDLIREKRSVHALHRPVFLQYLLEAAGETS